MIASRIVHILGSIACLAALAGCAVVKQDFHDCRYRGNDCRHERDRGSQIVFNLQDVEYIRLVDQAG